jgi:hypothetical protein
VIAFLETVAGELRRRDAAVDAARIEVDRLRRELDTRDVPAPPDRVEALAILGDETARVIGAAQDSAAEILRGAQNTAEEIKARAREEAARISAEAREYAEASAARLAAQAEEVRERLRAEVQRARAGLAEEADEIVGVARAEADELRRRTLADLARVRADAEHAAASQQKGAEAMVRQRLVDAEAQAEAIVAGARERADRMVRQARQARERILAELNRQRVRVHAHVTELQDLQARTFGEVAAVKAALAGVLAELDSVRTVEVELPELGEEMADILGENLHADASTDGVTGAGAASDAEMADLPVDDAVDRSAESTPEEETSAATVDMPRQELEVPKVPAQEGMPEEESTPEPATGWDSVAEAPAEEEVDALFERVVAARRTPPGSGPGVPLEPSLSGGFEPQASQPEVLSVDVSAAGDLGAEWGYLDAPVQTDAPEASDPALEQPDSCTPEPQTLQRIRAALSRLADDVDAATGDTPTPPAPPDAGGEEPPAVPSRLVPADPSAEQVAAVLGMRDAAVAELAPIVARKLKRAVQESENAVAAGATPSSLWNYVQTHTSTATSEAFVRGWLDAPRHVGLPVTGDDPPPDVEATVGRVLREVAAEWVDGWRAALADAETGTADPFDATAGADRLRAFRTTAVDVAEDVVRAAYAAGLVSRSGHIADVHSYRWVADPDAGCAAGPVCLRVGVSSQPAADVPLGVVASGCRCAVMLESRAAHVTGVPPAQH